MKPGAIPTKFSPRFKPWAMQYLVLFLGLVVACDKPKVNENESVNIIYEVQTTVTGFTQVKFGRFVSLPNGFSGIVMENWTISGTGAFTRIEPIRRGFIAELFAVHPTSDNWSLKIKATNGTVLRAGTPVFIPDSNFYSASISAAVQ